MVNNLWTVSSNCGAILRPDYEGYDEARSLYNDMIHKRPSVIVQCSGNADEIDTVNIARANELLVAAIDQWHRKSGGKGLCHPKID